MSEIERAYTVQQIAEAWNSSVAQVTRIFEGEPGVINLGSKTQRSLRIPQSVLERVVTRRAKKEYEGESDALQAACQVVFGRGQKPGTSPVQVPGMATQSDKRRRGKEKPQDKRLGGSGEDYRSLGIRRSV